MAVTNGYRHFAGLKGTKVHTVGSDESAFQYSTIHSAVAAAQNGDVIRVYPGTYSFTTQLTINKPIWIEAVGKVNIDGGTLGLATSLIDINVPVSYSSAVYVTLKNLIIDNAYANTDAITVNNNGGAGQSLYLNIDNCSGTANGTGNWINVSQSSAYLMVVKIFSNKMDSITLSNIALTQAASQIWFIGMDLGVVALGTTSAAWQVYYVKCMYTGVAQDTGGAAAVIKNGWDNVRKNSGAIAAEAKNDFDATSASENFTTNTLL